MGQTHGLAVAIVMGLGASCGPSAPPVAPLAPAAATRAPPAAAVPPVRAIVVAPAPGDAAAHSALPVPSVTAPSGTPALAFVDRQGDYRLRHAGLAMAFAITPDGAVGATGAIDGTVIVWDLARGVPLRTIATPHTNVYAVALSPDGSQLVASGTDETTDLWTVATGVRVWSAKPGADTLDFTARGDRIVGARSHVARVWIARTGALAWDGHAHEVQSSDQGLAATVAPDGRSSVELTGIGWREVRMGDTRRRMPSTYTPKRFDLDSGSELKAYPAASDPSPFAVGITPRGDRVVVRAGKRLAVVDDQSGTVLADLAVSDRDGASAIAFARDLDQVVTWDDQHNTGPLIAWDLRARRELWRATTSYAAGPRVVGGDVIVMRMDGACVARRIADGVELWRRDGCSGYGTSAASPTLLVGTGASAFDVVDVATGRSLLPAVEAHAPHGWLAGLVTAADGRVAGVGSGREVWMWDASGGHVLPPASPAGSDPELHFLADGRLVAIDHLGRGDARVLRYAADGSALEATTPVPHHDPIASHVVYAGERALVDEILESGYHRSVIELRGDASPKHVAEWRQPSGPHMTMRSLDLRGVVVTRDLARAYVTSPDARVLGYDLGSGRVASESPARGRDVPLALSADGARVVAAWKDGDVAILDGATLAIVRTLAGAPAAATAVAISPDGTLVVAATPAGLVAWRAADGQVVAVVDFSATREAPSVLAFAQDGATVWVGTSVGNLVRLAVLAR